MVTCPPPPQQQIITLTIEPRMIIIFWAHIPISFQHVSFLCPFLEPLHTHSEIIDQLK